MQRKYIWISESIWWVGSLIAAMLIIWPYYPALIVKVPFLVPNMILAVLMVQCLRLTFFLRQSPLAGSRKLIFMLTFAFIPISMYSVRHFRTMSHFFESSNWIHSFSYLLSISEKSEIAQYIRTEFTWLTVIVFIGAFAFSSRMVMASWRILGKKQKV